MIWLGTKRGYLTDWFTQRWVQCTGRRIRVEELPWLEGPVAPTTGIGDDYFDRLAGAEGLRILRPEQTAGILPSFNTLHGPSFDPGKVNPEVVRFYEETSRYDLDVWTQWCGIFRPFGWLLAIIFSRRLQQLNLPLSGLDTSRGVTSEVLQFLEPDNAALRRTAWFRRLRSSGRVIYAGFYSACTLPGRDDPCVKVVFPLPNGNAVVILRTEVKPDGSFLITSAGQRFGDPGLYFTVHGGAGKVWARYVRSLRETIHVLPAENGFVRADHVLHYFGAVFLRLHYRMQRRA